MANIQDTTKHVEKGINKIADTIKTASKDFQSETNVDLDQAADFLQPVADYTLKAWRTTVDYSRRHPVRIAITVAALGLVAAKMLQANRNEA